MIVDSKNRSIVFDAESDGFMDQVTKMWCVVAQDYNTSEMFLFHDYPEYDNHEGVDDSGEQYKLPVRSGNLEEGVRFIHRAKQRICHNMIGYDERLMKKFFPKYRMKYKYPEVRDTMIESQLQWFDRPAEKGYKGIHGLAVWGARFGIRKPEIEDWSTMTPAKLHRCLEDVKINTATAKFLEEERELMFTMFNRDCIPSLITEHEYAYWSAIQETNGALVDVPHMEECVVDLTEKVKVLADLIEPQLPPTIVYKPTKETTAFVAKALGVKKKIAITYEYRERQGVSKRYEIKDWHKPCTKWWTTEKGKLYGISRDGEVLMKPQFKKLKLARDHAKQNYDLPKKSKFTYPNVEVETRSVDIHNSKHFEGQLDTTEIVGAFTKIEISDSRMSQHEKVKLLLVGLGWDTDEWTFKKENKQDVRAANAGSVQWPDYKVNGFQLTCHYKKGEKIPHTPQISDDSYDTLPDGLGKNISEYNSYSHRRNFIKNPTKDDKGLLNNIREDGRITCGLIGFGTTAGRATQYNWVNAPGVKALYGEQIRKIIIASEGHQLIGVDMPSAHPRLLADFTQNEQFIKSVDGNEVDPETGEFLGEDYHTVNSVLFGLNTVDKVAEAVRSQCKVLIGEVLMFRGIGKGGSYCTLYGGSDKKLALTIKIDINKGAKIKQDFLSGLGLDLLLDEVEETWDYYKWKRGSFMKVLGNYMVFCNSKHKIINYKALGSEAVVQKHATIWINREMFKLGLKSKQIINMHDELLFEVPDDEVEIMKDLCSNMYPSAAKQLGLTLDWSSFAMVGPNYAECH